MTKTNEKNGNRSELKNENEKEKTQLNLAVMYVNGKFDRWWSENVSIPCRVNACWAVSMAQREREGRFFFFRLDGQNLNMTVTLLWKPALTSWIHGVNTIFLVWLEGHSFEMEQLNRKSNSIQLLFETSIHCYSINLNRWLWFCKHGKGANIIIQRLQIWLNIFRKWWNLCKESQIFHSIFWEYNSILWKISADSILRKIVWPIEKFCFKVFTRIRILIWCQSSIWSLAIFYSVFSWNFIRSSTRFYSLDHFNNG